jgi:pimeloyl-ACP methyl ester carboxylesterase
MTAMPFTSRGGVRLRFEVEGTGSDLLVAPHLGGNIEWIRIAGWPTALAGHRLILAEPRGHGQSDRPLGVEAHRVAEYADDLLAIIRAAGAGTVAAMGISDGSQMCAGLASEHPGVVTTVIDLDGWDDRDLCEDPIRAQRLEYSRAIRSMGYAGALRSWGIASGAAEEPPLVRELIREDSEMVALEMEAWTQWRGPVSVLPRLKLPILRFVNGQRDRTEIDRIRQQSGSNVELHVIPGKSHWDLCTQPDHASGIIRAFLDRVGS